MPDRAGLPERATDDPVHALAVLPLDSRPAERQWLQDILACLKHSPPEDRGRRLRYLADEIRKDGTVQERFQQIWTPSNAARLISEAGLPDATSLFRALLVRWEEAADSQGSRTTWTSTPPCRAPNSMPAMPCGLRNSAMRTRLPGGTS